MKKHEPSCCADFYRCAEFIAAELPAPKTGVHGFIYKRIQEMLRDPSVVQQWCIEYEHEQEIPNPWLREMTNRYFDKPSHLKE